MVDIIQESNLSERAIRARDLVRETKLANFAKMANMLIDLFGLDYAFQNYVKPEREGQAVEMYFPALQGSLKIVLTRNREMFDVSVEKPENPVATIIINVKREISTRLVSNIIRSKSNIFGILKLVPKLLTGKIKIKGSLGAVITLVRILMVGKNKIYKERPIK